MGMWVGFLGGFYQPVLAGVTGAPNPGPPPGAKAALVASVAVVLFILGRAVV